MIKRFLRGSSSRSSREKQNEEAQKPKYNLPRTAEASPTSSATNTNSPYLVPLAAIHAYRNPTSATEPEPEPQFEPPRQSNYQWDPEMISNQWQSESSSSQYDPSYNYGYPPGHLWQ